MALDKKRFILGNRPGEFGVFASPPGVDAGAATADQLLLHITSAIPQIAMQGVVAAPFPVPRVVPHALGYAPIIFPNLISTKILNGGFSYQRPFDNVYGPWTRSKVKSEATQFTFEQELISFNGNPGTALDINYFAITRPIP